MAPGTRARTRASSWTGNPGRPLGRDPDKQLGRDPGKDPGKQLPMIKRANGLRPVVRHSTKIIVFVHRIRVHSESVHENNDHGGVRRGAGPAARTPKPAARTPKPTVRRRMVTAPGRTRVGAYGSSSGGVHETRIHRSPGALTALPTVPTVERVRDFCTQRTTYLGSPARR